MRSILERTIQEAKDKISKVKKKKVIEVYSND